MHCIGVVLLHGAFPCARLYLARSQPRWFYSIPHSSWPHGLTILCARAPSFLQSRAPLFHSRQIAQIRTPSASATLYHMSVSVSQVTTPCQASWLRSGAARRCFVQRPLVIPSRATLASFRRPGSAGSKWAYTGSGSTGSGGSGSGGDSHSSGGGGDGGDDGNAIMNLVHREH